MEYKDKQLNNAMMNNLAEFTTMSNGPHCTRFDFDGEDPDRPSKSTITLTDAISQCQKTEREFGCLGVEAQIYHLPSKLIVKPYGALANIQKPFAGLFLAKGYLSGEKHKKRLEHTEGVANFAAKVAKRVSERNLALNLSPEFVEWLGYVHDIGYSIADEKHEVHTIDLLVKEVKVPADIARYAMHGQLAEQFGEKEGNVEQYLPLGLEGKILTYADMSVRVGEPVPMKERAREIIARIKGIPTMPEQLKQDIETNMYKALPRFESYEAEILSLAGLTAAKEF